MKKVICHNIKIERVFFDSVLDGSKTFEIRFDDREYAAGDFVVLHETNGDKGLTGHTIEKRIGFITEYEQQEGYVVFSLLDLSNKQ